MKEYMQPEVELVQFTSESVASSTGPITGVGGSTSNIIPEDEIKIPGQP